MSFSEHAEGLPLTLRPVMTSPEMNPGAMAVQRRISMLKGFNYPLTPKGKSTLNPPPPWHYSADFLNIEFWAEPAAVAAVLPQGLDPDRSANGHANALFYDWQFSGANDEYLD